MSGLGGERGRGGWATLDRYHSYGSHDGLFRGSFPALLLATNQSASLLERFALELAPPACVHGHAEAKGCLCCPVYHCPYRLLGLKIVRGMGLLGFRVIVLNWQVFSILSWCRWAGFALLPLGVFASSTLGCCDSSVAPVKRFSVVSISFRSALSVGSIGEMHFPGLIYPWCAPYSSPHVRLWSCRSLCLSPPGCSTERGMATVTALYVTGTLRVVSAPVFSSGACRVKMAGIAEFITSDELTFVTYEPAECR